MRVEVNLDDELVKRAEQLTGIDEISYLLRQALKSIIARESGRRLALLGGSDPDVQPIPRWRSEPE